MYTVNCAIRVRDRVLHTAFGLPTLAPRPLITALRQNNLYGNLSTVQT